MKVLVIGGGGRCHAIVDALSRSQSVEKIYCAPGNAGIARQAETVALKDTDVEGLVAFARREAIDLTIVGPEAALAAGIADRFAAEGLRLFGPTRAAARIETSKEFAKELMERNGIPTARYRYFTEYEPALQWVKAHPLPAVLKFDGLAAGKGVVIAASEGEADEALRAMLVEERFGRGGVVIEEFLEGPEFSMMCLVSGTRVVPLALAQDHKRAWDGDRGPNTGGMGAYSPVPCITREDERFALERIMRPTARALAEAGTPFCGVLYGGLMKTRDGIKVIEFNARFGDPETEVVLPRLKSDLARLCMDVMEGREACPRWHDFATVGIVLAAEGYPGSYGKGFEIGGLDRVKARVYHMGTVCDGGTFRTAGGRVLIVVGEGATLAEARQRAAEGVEAVDCPQLFHRSDIALKALQ